MTGNDNQLPPCGRLTSVAEAAVQIASGRFFSIAGDESLLRALPRGNWIGGTIPYFMGQEGGVSSRDQVFVSEIETFGETPQIRFYDVTNLSQVCVDAPANGYSMIIIPAFSATHSLYARNAPGFEDMFVKPVVGWISGVHLDELGSAAPAVVDGRSGTVDTERAVVMHVPLPADRYARLDIINLLEQGEGDRIRFPSTGFSAGECTINGEAANLADYLTARAADLRLPLVADYSGAMINVSIKGIDETHRRVDFYAPVFDDVEYRFAAPQAKSAEAVDEGAGGIAFSCNCVLNYLYNGLEGRKTGRFTGPITFGEIAYLLLNQTLVYLTVERA